MCVEVAGKNGKKTEFPSERLYSVQKLVLCLQSYRQAVVHRLSEFILKKKENLEENMVRENINGLIGREYGIGFNQNICRIF